MGLRSRTCGSTPEKLIREDFAIEGQRSGRLRELLVSEAVGADRVAEELDALEVALPFSCEHVAHPARVVNSSGRPRPAGRGVPLYGRHAGPLGVHRLDPVPSRPKAATRAGVLDPIRTSWPELARCR